MPLRNKHHRGDEPHQFRMQFQLSPTPYQRRFRRIPTIRFQTMKHIRGNCMRNCCGGGAWPDFEAQRQTRQQRPGTTGVEGAGGSGGHGRASRSTTPSEARVWRSRGRPGPTAPGTPAAPQATTRGADSERAGRPHGGRKSVEAPSTAGTPAALSRNYSPARRSTSCMMRPHTALTQATAATPRTRERQGLTCRKSSKP